MDEETKVRIVEHAENCERWLWLAAAARREGLLKIAANCADRSETQSASAFCLARFA